jgi:ABC-type uncharacterized transport system involved in gliding motility auxiliary subunit
MKEPINLNPMFITPPASDKDLQPYDLAYILEGRFTSFFKGKTIPEKPMGEKKIDPKKDAEKQDKPSAPSTAKTLEGVQAANQILTTSRPAKIFVLGCTQMLHDNMLDQEGRSTNATFILNVVDHLNNLDKIAMMRSKQQTLNPIETVTPFTRGMIKTFNIAVLPVLVILLGLAVLVRRNARKKKIATLLNPSKGNSTK